MTKAIILLPLLMLAGCDSKPDIKATNASVGEVAAKVAAARDEGDFMRPGKWQVKGFIDDISIPGMPAGMADKMKQQGQNMPGTQSCLTAADVKKPGPDFFTGTKNCRYDHFSMVGGKVDAKMRCTSPRGIQTTAMAGEFGPEKYHMAMTTAMEDKAGAPATGMEAMTMKLHVEGTRLGECDAATAGKVAAK